jgi:hypothetical protein
MVDNTFTNNNQIISTLTDIETISSNTSLFIDTQNKTIENIIHNNNEIEYLQKKSVYAIRNLSFFGRIINWIFGEPEKLEKCENKDLSHPQQETQTQTQRQPQRQTQPNPNPHNDIDNYPYNEIQNILDNIEQSQLFIGNEIDKQNNKLNNINHKKNIIFSKL